MNLGNENKNSQQLNCTLKFKKKIQKPSWDQCKASLKLRTQSVQWLCDNEKETIQTFFILLFL